MLCSTSYNNYGITDYNFLHAAQHYQIRPKSKSPKDLLQCSISTKARTFASSFRNGISTFLIVRALSTISLDLATHWCGYGPLVHSRTMALHVVHGISVVMAMIMWSEYTAMWNVGIVIAISEGKRGLEAFSESSNLMRGIMLMIIDLAWKLGLGLPNLFPKWGFHGWFAYEVVDVVLVCFGRVMSWVVCVIYYYDCKNRTRV